MTKDEALRLALEALKHGGCPPDCKDGMTDSGGVHPWGEAALIPCPNCKTISAIKQALANDAIDKMAENERELGIQMQPEPEPVAWDNCRGEKQCRIWCGNSACVSHWNYTSPPKREWQGLTDEEINACDPQEECWNLSEVAHAIEAKLKQKNGFAEEKNA